jgi:hypothetical protein
MMDYWYMFLRFPQVLIVVDYGDRRSRDEEILFFSLILIVLIFNRNAFIEANTLLLIIQANAIVNSHC